jgi:hypothetical protein
MVVVSTVAKGFSDRHLFSDRPSVAIANIVYLATTVGCCTIDLATDRKSSYYTFSNQQKVALFTVVINNNIHLIKHHKSQNFIHKP